VNDLGIDCSEVILEKGEGSQYTAGHNYPTLGPSREEWGGGASGISG
jgi:hypothetical protein